MIEKLKVGIVGSTGYAGTELLRLLLDHPLTDVTALSSVSFGGKGIAEIYPGFAAACDIVLDKDPERMLDSCDVVFASLPHGLSEEIAAKCIKKNVALIDLGADFRLTDESVYREWYGSGFMVPHLHKEAVYGLCEVYREDIKNVGKKKMRLVANPGCYPTSASLALYPALKDCLIDYRNIIIDAKSGVTGAGRSVTRGTHFPECNEAFSAYKAGGHRHRPEIEETLSRISGSGVNVTFTPHLLPLNRGILSTIYCDMKEDYSAIRRCYEEVFSEEPFVVVLDEGRYANVKDVRMTNCCHISLHKDMHTGKLIILSAIDNMVKGAAGQAIQNMNIVFGFPEIMGLPKAAPAF